jgi:hypothetical protein
MCSGRLFPAKQLIDEDNHGGNSLMSNDGNSSTAIDGEKYRLSIKSFIDHLDRNYRAITNLHTLQFTNSTH